MKRSPGAPRYAERTLVGMDDSGAEERVVLWLERRAGGLWAVGRSVDPGVHAGATARPGDILFEGYELEDALARANEALEDEVNVLERDGRQVDARPFTRKEVLPLLERWFFNR